MSRDPIEPCLGCEKSADELYCSDRCMREDSGRVLQSAETGELFYATEVERTNGGTFIANDTRPIDWDGEVVTDE